MLPKVSVVIPTHNRAPFVLEAVNSVLSQSFKDFELIVIDDGSHDHTFKSLSSHRDHIVYHYQKNQGVSAARNKGISLSKGEWICFLDSDDLWTPQKLEVQFHATQSTGFLASYTDEIWYRKNKRVNPKIKHEKHSGFIFEKCLPLCIISPSSVMLHKSIFENVGYFDERLPACEDYDLWLRIATQYPFLLVRKPLIIKRNGLGKQLSSQYWGLDRFRVSTLEKLLREVHLTSMQRKLVWNELKKKSNILMQGSFKRKKILQGFQYYRKSIGASLKLTFH